MSKKKISDNKNETEKTTTSLKKTLEEKEVIEASDNSTSNSVFIKENFKIRCSEVEDTLTEMVQRIHAKIGRSGWIIGFLVIVLVFTICIYEGKLRTHQEEQLTQSHINSVIPQFYNSREIMNRNILNEQRRIDTMIRQREEMMDKYFRQLQWEPVRAGTTLEQSFQWYRSDDSVKKNYYIDTRNNKLYWTYTTTNTAQRNAVQQKLSELGLKVQINDNELTFNGHKNQLQEVLQIVQ